MVTVLYADRIFTRYDICLNLLCLSYKMFLGQLPWRKIKDKDEVGRIKRSFQHDDLLKHERVPLEFEPFLRHIQNLTYHDQVSYSRFFKL